MDQSSLTIVKGRLKKSTNNPPYIQLVGESPNKSFHGFLMILSLLAIVRGSLIKGVNNPYFIKIFRVTLYDLFHWYLVGQSFLTPCKGSLNKSFNKPLYIQILRETAYIHHTMDINGSVLIWVQPLMHPFIRGSIGVSL